MLSFSQIMADNYAAFFSCTPVGRAPHYDDPEMMLFNLVGMGRSFLSDAWSAGVQLVRVGPCKIDLNLPVILYY